MNSDDLPPGWSMEYDPTTGFHYFIDHNNQITTWQDPRSSILKSGITVPVEAVEVPVKIVKSPSIYEEDTSTNTIQTHLAFIESVQHKLDDIKKEIDNLSPIATKTREYLELEDKLDKFMSQLDDIDSEGDETVRNKRREVVKVILNLLNDLEKKLIKDAEVSNALVPIITLQDCTKDEDQAIKVE